MKLKYLESPDFIPLCYRCDRLSERRFTLLETIDVELSDGYVLTIEKGFETDLSSVPGWAWSLFKPMDRALIGDLIHDKLWDAKQDQFKYFNWSIYDARKFADEERHRWRTSIAPEKKLKNFITHRLIRLIGGFFYSRQLRIPD